MTIRKAAEFIKNADVRAGKIPGWPSKPETSGDPLDPNNMARCDAHVIVNDGAIMQGACGANAAEKVAVRGVLVKVFLVLLILYGAASFFGYDQAIKQSLMPEKKVASSLSEAEEGKQLKELITKFYRAAGSNQDKEESAEKNDDGSPVAKKYELKYLRDNYGWPSKRKFPNLIIDEAAYKNYQAMSDEVKAASAKEIEELCRRYGHFDMTQCLPSVNQKHKVAAYLAREAEDPAFYGVSGDEYGESYEQAELGLAKFLAAFPKTAASYCDSENRLFAETWTAQETMEQLPDVYEEWTKKGNVSEKATIVSSMKELIAHRIDGDKECKNLNVTALKVNSGAIKYLLSVKARYTVNGENNIATKLYFLADLNAGREVVAVACANCGGITALSKVMDNGVISSLTNSAEGVIEAFEDSNMTLGEE